jgi:N-acetyl-gamma-glutamyl-phosphate reductase/acetylglutamate kinase
MPYALGGHIHEREVTAQLRSVAKSLGAAEFGDLQFVPHVAPWFRGITMTITATLSKQHSDAELRELLLAYYAGEPLVHVAAPGAIPEVRQIAGRCGAIVSAFASPTAERPGRIVLCAVVDNLLKGAASQCLQNINLLCGFEETLAIPVGLGGDKA